MRGVDTDQEQFAVGATTYPGEAIPAIRRDGFAVSIAIEYDGDTRPEQFEAYGPAQIAAWRRDEWCFIGIVVTASREGLALGSASLWGLVSNDGAHAREVAADLATEAIEVARATLVRLADLVPAPTYQGWTNRATWATMLWLGNDQGWHEAIRTLQGPDDLRAFVEGHLLPDLDGLAGDLLRQVARGIDYEAIAEAFREKIDEDEGRAGHAAD